MPRHRVLTGLLAIVVGASVYAASPVPEQDGTVPLAAPRAAAVPPDVHRQRALTSGSRWSAFTAREGDWSVLWNEATGTPHRAFGPAIPASTRMLLSADDARTAALDFITGHAGLFGADAGRLRFVRASHVRGKWYVSFVQTERGWDVLLSEVEIRLSDAGRVMAFGSDAWDVQNLPDQPSLSPAAAARAALVGLPGPARSVDGPNTGRLCVLPIAGDGMTRFHLAYEVHILQTTPPGNFVAFVDAVDGTVLWRFNRVRYQVGGRAEGDVQLILPTDPFVTRPLSSMHVMLGAVQVASDSTGGFAGTSAESLQVTAGLSGSWVDVHRADGPDASFSRIVHAGDSVIIRWDGTNAHPAERDGFFHATLIHDFITRLDPLFTEISYSMPCVVNINETCNAFWDGEGVNFFAAGGGCPNTAQMPDVVYHEYGHGINDKLYEQLGRPFGMINGAAHEGLADVAAAMIMDDYRVGRGFFGPGTILRSLLNTNTYPQNVSSDPHITGLILGGAFWDLRVATSVQTMRELSHFAKYGLPDDPNDGVMFGEWFLETLIADDDDGNLANGTPHSAAIIAAFNAHGIGSQLFFRQSFSHEPLPSTDDSTEAYVAVFSLGGIPGVGPDSVALAYSTDGWVTSHVVPAEEFLPSTYRAAIPPQPGGTLVRYFITAHDPVGNESFAFPSGAPGSGSYRFLVGRQLAEPGVLYAAANGSPSGFLYRIDPQNGNATLMGPLGLQSVQALAVHPGTHELYAFSGGTGGTSVYRVSPALGDAILEWTIPVRNLRAAVFAGGDTLFLADAGSRLYRCVGTDTTGIATNPGLFIASLALHPADGSLWASVRPPLSQRDRIYRIDRETGVPTLVGATGDNLATPAITFGPGGVLYGVKNPSTQISTLIRISTVDGTGTPVGATGVEGLVALGMRMDTLVTSVGPAERTLPGTHELGQNYPNPFNGETKIGYRIQGAGNGAGVTLKVYDVLGREVMTLVNGPLLPGDYSVAVPAGDLPSGVYFYRLQTASFTAQRKMLLLR